MTMQTPSRSLLTALRRCWLKSIQKGMPVLNHFQLSYISSQMESHSVFPLFHVFVCRESIIRRQGQVDKQYAGLKELAEDRSKKLHHTYHHFLLSREVEDLEQWIAERDVVASSQEMGQDLDHVTVLKNTHKGRKHNK